MDKLELANLVSRFTTEGDQDLIQVLQRVGGAFNVLNGVIRPIPRKMARAATAMRELAEAGTSAATAIQQINASAVTQLADTMAALKSHVTGLPRQMNNLAGGMDKFAASGILAAQTMQKLGQSSAAFAVMIAGANARIDSLERKIEKLHRQLRMVQHQVRANSQRLKEMGKAAVIAAKKTDVHTMSIEALRTNLNRLAFSMVRVGMAMTALITIPLGAFLRYAIAASATATEIQNLFDVVFAEVRDQAEQTAVALARMYEISPTTMMNMMAKFSDLLAGMGVRGQESLDLSKWVAQLSADIASMKNIAGGAEEVMDIISSAMGGRRARLRRIGAMVLESDIKQEARNQGMDPNTMTKYQKNLIMLRLVWDRVQNSIGDVQRTWASLANQMRAASESAKDIAISVGNLLVDSLKLDKIMQMVNRGFRWISKAIKGMNPYLVRATAIVSAILAAIGPILIAITSIVLAVTGVLTLIGLAAGAGVSFGAVMAGVAFVIGGILVAIGGIVGGVMAIRAFIENISTQIAAVSRTVFMFFSNIEMNLQVLFEWLRQQWPNILLDVVELGGRLLAFIAKLWQSVILFSIGALNIIIRYIMTRLPFVLFEMAGVIVQWAVDLGIAFAKGLIAGLLGGRSAFIAALRTFMPHFMDEGDFAKEMGELFGDTFGGLQNPFRFNYRTDLPDFLSGLLPGGLPPPPGTKGKNKDEIIPAVTDLAPAMLAGSVAAYSAIAKDRQRNKVEIILEGIRLAAQAAAAAAEQIAEDGVDMDLEIL